MLLIEYCRAVVINLKYILIEKTLMYKGSGPSLLGGLRKTESLKCVSSDTGSSLGLFFPCYIAGM